MDYLRFPQRETQRNGRLRQQPEFRGGATLCITDVQPGSATNQSHPATDQYNGTHRRDTTRPSGTDGSSAFAATRHHRVNRHRGKFPNCQTSPHGGETEHTDRFEITWDSAQHRHDLPGHQPGLPTHVPSSQVFPDELVRTLGSTKRPTGDDASGSSASGTRRRQPHYPDGSQRTERTREFGHTRREWSDSPELTGQLPALLRRHRQALTTACG
jgi:hypothetical protein